MFDFLFKKSRLEKELALHLSPERAKQLLSNPHLLNPEPTYKSVELDYLFVFVAGETPPQISEHASQVCDIAHKHEALVYDILGPLLTIGVGPGNRLHDTEQFGNRFELVNELSQKIGPFIKIIHGKSPSHIGTIGGPNRFSYGFIIPQFDRILATLPELSFGDVREFVSAQAQTQLQNPPPPPHA